MIFIENKYTQYYRDIISKAKNSLRVKYRGEYYERHHILPKSLGGDNSKENLILLTAREHFICHLLLIKMVDGQNRNRMMCAFYQMKRSPKNMKRVVTSRFFETFKRQRSEALSQLYKGKKKPDGFGDKVRKRLKGIPLSEEHRRKVSLNHHNVAGKNNPRFGIKFSEETRARISIAMTGNRVGIKNHMFGNTHTDEVKEKISAHGKAKWTPEMKKKMIETRKRNKLIRDQNAIQML